MSLVFALRLVVRPKAHNRATETFFLFQPVRHRLIFNFAERIWLRHLFAPGRFPLETLVFIYVKAKP
jgi:hypothetical protein